MPIVGIFPEVALTRAKISLLPSKGKYAKRLALISTRTLSNLLTIKVEDNQKRL